MKSLKYDLVRYDVDADAEPIYSTRLLVARFANGGTANHCARTLQSELPGQTRGMFRVETGRELSRRCLYSAR